MGEEMSLTIRTFLGTVIVALASFFVFLILNELNTPKMQKNIEDIIATTNLINIVIQYSSNKTNINEIIKQTAEATGVTILREEPSGLIQGKNLTEEEATTIKSLSESHLTSFITEKNNKRTLWVPGKGETKKKYFIGFKEKERLSKPSLFAISTLIAGILVLLWSYITSILILNPLKNLQQITQKIEPNKIPEKVEVKGPKEVREVLNAFNQMTERLQKADEDKKIALAGIAHDLKTPLTRMRIAAEFSSDKDLQNEIIHDVEQIDTMVDQFLHYFESSSANYKTEELYLEEYLTQMFEFYNFPREHIFLNIQKEKIIVNPIAIKRILLNLIKNSLKYANYFPNIQIATHNNIIYMEIADHGPGIPQDSLEHLLKPFVRGDLSRSETKGVGLGLAIINNLVSHENGKIGYFDNNPGLKVVIQIPYIQKDGSITKEQKRIDETSKFVKFRTKIA